MYSPLFFFSFSVTDSAFGQPEALNEKAVQIINRVRDKLTGTKIIDYLFIYVENSVDVLTYTIFFLKDEILIQIRP